MSNSLSILEPLTEHIINQRFRSCCNSIIIMIDPSDAATASVELIPSVTVMLRKYFLTSRQSKCQRQEDKGVSNMC